MPTARLTVSWAEYLAALGAPPSFVGDGFRPWERLRRQSCAQLNESQLTTLPLSRGEDKMLGCIRWA